jgi:hypothetical protein
VADNIINLQFSYDVINTPRRAPSNANVPNPIAAGLSPALIQKVNIWVIGEKHVVTGQDDIPKHVSGKLGQRPEHEFLQCLQFLDYCLPVTKAV